MYHYLTFPSELYSSDFDRRQGPSEESTGPFVYQPANHRTSNQHCLGSLKYQSPLTAAKFRKSYPSAASR